MTETSVRSDDAAGLESAAGSGPERFPCLDGYRALAALAVVMTHIGFDTGESLHGHAASWLARGDVGVPVFFALSGFLLYRPMAAAVVSGRPLPRVRRYLWRRALRVLPAYWVAVTLAIVLISLNHRARSDWAEWLTQLSLTQVYRPDHELQGLTQTWSLCVEVTFYLALPLWPRAVARVCRRLRVDSPDGRARVDLTGLALLAAAAYGWILVLHQTSWLDAGIADLWLPDHLDWFAAGMALAVLRAAGDLPAGDLPAGGRAGAGRVAPWVRELADAPVTCWLLAAGVLVLATTPLAGPLGLTNSTSWQACSKEALYLAFAVLLLLPGMFGDFSSGLPRRLLRSRPLHELGRASYGLFLLHLTVLALVYQWLPIHLFGGRLALVTAIVLPVSVVLAFLSLYLVETPALRLAQRRATPAPAGTVPAPAR